jgi:hypothetical protein
LTCCRSPILSNPVVTYGDNRVQQEMIGKQQSAI